MNRENNTDTAIEVQTASREITIVNELGLHARPASEFVRCATRFRSEIFLVKDGQRLSAASILDVLMADLCQGQSATIEAHGSDAELAVTALAELVHSLTD